MIELSASPRPLLGVGVLFVILTLSACTVGGSTDPTASTASPDTTATVGSRSLSQTALADQARPVPASSNDARSVAQHLAEANVEARIKQALVREPSLRLFDFHPEVVDGRATIQGDVNTYDQYRRAERVTRSVDDVEAVTNELTVKGDPVSEEDAAAETQAEASTDSEEAKGVYYTVQAGDTLWEIARKHETSVRQIRSLNDLRSSSLRPGERIRIR